MLVIPAKAGIQRLLQPTKTLDPGLTSPSAVEKRLAGMTFHERRGQAL
jgi:hypothetical protein